MHINQLIKKAAFIVVDNDDHVIGVDVASGGYPFMAFGPWDIKWWHAREDAEQWITHWPNKYRVIEVVNIEVYNG